MEFGGFYSFDIYRSSSNLTVAGKDVKPLAVMSNQDRYWEDILPFDEPRPRLQHCTAAGVPFVFYSLPIQLCTSNLCK